METQREENRVQEQYSQSPSQSCNKVGVHKVTSAEEIYPKPRAGLDSVVRWDPREKQLLSKLLSFIVWFVFFFFNEKMHPLYYMTFLAVLYTSTQWVMPVGSFVRQSTKPHGRMHSLSIV